MEASQVPLAIESFSYSWVINIKPCFETLHDASDEALAPFIEMDPKLTASKRFLSNSQQEFNFDLPIFPHQSPPLTLVHADELFSNGLLRPLFIKPSKMESQSVPASPLPPKSSRFLLTSSGLHCNFISRCRRSSKRIFLKYLSFLRPLYRRAQPSRLGEYSGQSSPRMLAKVYSNGNWCHYMDNSISEAILHCKRSIEN